MRNVIKNTCEPLFSDEDSDLISPPWHRQSQGYARRKRLYAHRVVLARKLGRELAAGEVCDHANGNKQDNRRENLRLATPAQNSQNIRPHGIAGMRGVSPIKGGNFVAVVRSAGKNHYCGVYSTPEAAAAAASAKRSELGFFGESGELLSAEEIAKHRKTKRNLVLTAFGETRSVLDWTRDSRCVVDYQTLARRTKQGWPPEFALTAKRWSRPVGDDESANQCNFARRGRVGT